MSRKSLYLERVYILLKQLLNGHAINTTDFALQFNVDRKIIWRDIINVVQPIFPNTIQYNRSTKTWVATEELRSKKFFNIEELVIIGQLLQLSKETNQKLYQATLNLFETLHEKSSHAIYKQPSIEDIDAYREQFLEIQKAIGLREKIAFSIKDTSESFVHVDSLREQIVTTPFRVRNKNNTKKIYIKISAGVTQNSQKDKDPFAVMKRADNTLYKAKKAGRNQVIKG